MPKYPQVSQLKEKLEGTKEVLVVLPAVPQMDQVAAGLALYLALQQQGKRVFGVSAKPMMVEFNRLVGVDKITDKVGNKNLLISWPHEGDTIEKISYHVDEKDGTFNIVVEPREGFSSVDEQQIKFGYQGVRAGVVILVGAKHPDDLGHLADELGGLIENEAEVVRIDTRPHPKHERSVDVIDEEVSSLSELVHHLLTDLEWDYDADVATNLLHGVFQRTNQLMNPQIGAETYEVVAKLMRAGGRRPQISSSSESVYREYRGDQKHAFVESDSTTARQRKVGEVGQATAGLGGDQGVSDMPEDKEYQEKQEEPGTSRHLVQEVPEPFVSDTVKIKEEEVEQQQVGGDVPEPWLKEPQVYSGGSGEE